MVSIGRKCKAQWTALMPRSATPCLIGQSTGCTLGGHQATMHNGIQVELYKYSKWARAQLCKQLNHMWDTAKIPVKTITGVGTPCHKSGGTDDYVRYRMIFVFPAEYKVFAPILLKRVLTECFGYLSDSWKSAFREDRGTSDVHYLAKQLYHVITGRGSTAVAVHLDFTSAFDSMSHIYLFNALKRAGASVKMLHLFKATYQCYGNGSCQRCVA